MRVGGDRNGPDVPDLINEMARPGVRHDYRRLMASCPDVNSDVS